MNHELRYFPSLHAILHGNSANLADSYLVLIEPAIEEAKFRPGPGYGDNQFRMYD